MSKQTIADIYAANNKISQEFEQKVENLTDEQANFQPEGEQWSIAQLIEHVSMVEQGMSKISAKLLTQAQAAGKTSDGRANLTANFATKAAEAHTLKFEAPPMVHPTGEKTIKESLAKLAENRQKLEELRPLFESVECSDFKFPHPFMGELSAHEWLVLIGGHKARHLAQIENILKNHEK